MQLVTSISILVLKWWIDVLENALIYFFGKSVQYKAMASGRLA